MKEVSEKILNRSEQKKYLDMPPNEILLSNEKVEFVPEEDVFNAIDKAIEKDSFSKRTKKFLKRWALLGVISLSINYAASLYQENIKKEPGQEDETEQLNPEAVPEIVVYGHRDKKTDDFLNYISDKEDLPQELQVEIRAKLFLSLVNNTLENYNDYIASGGTPEDIPLAATYFDSIFNKINNFTEDSWEEYLANKNYKQDVVDLNFAVIDREYFETHPYQGNSYEDKFKYIRLRELNSEYKAEGVENMTDEQFEDYMLFGYSSDFEGEPINGKEVVFDTKKYDAIWTMHFNHGNPGMDLSSKYSKYYQYGNRAYYDPLLNKMYVGSTFNRASMLDDWLAELSHAEQYSKKPYTSYIRDLLFRFRIMFSSLKDSSMNEIYESSYNEPGTIEYEAHSIIQPKLEKEYGNRRISGHKDISSK